MSTPFTKLGAEIFRDFETDGVPASGNHKPVKQDVRDYLFTVETALDATSAAQNPLVAPLAWAQLTRYRSTFTTAV